MLLGVPLTEKFQVTRIVLILNEINSMAAFIRPRFFESNIKFFNKFRLKPTLNSKLQIYKNQIPIFL